MTGPRAPDEMAKAVAVAFGMDERRKVDQSKAVIWSALSVIAIMAALVATVAVVPVVIFIFRTLL